MNRINISINKIGLFLLLATTFSCKKGGDPTPTPTPGGGGVVVPPPITPAVDPATANTIGFFLDDWQPKSFVKPAFADAAIPSSTATTVTAATKPQRH